MWVGRRIGSGWFVGTSVGALILGALFLGFIIIGTPIAVVVTFIQAIPTMTWGEWGIIAAIATPVVAFCIYYWRLPGDEHLDGEPEREVLRPNRLRQPR